LENLEPNSSTKMEQTNEFAETARQLDNLVSLGIALSEERNREKLLEMIMYEARRVTNADAGTLYLVEEEKLRMKIIHNETMGTFQGGKGENIDLPPVPISRSYVSGYVAATGKSVNLPDVYQAEGFDFSGPRKYDRMTGYRTQSMLVIPLRNHLREIIGVLQLINARAESKSGEVISFDPRFQSAVESLSSLAAIALTNMQLIQDIENLFESFVQVMVTAIDARTPYNATHTQKVNCLAKLIAQEIHAEENGPFAGEYYDEDRLKELAMAGWLHDIGKIATPLEVMNKSTRLGDRLPLVLTRLDYAQEREKALSLEKMAGFLEQGRLQEANQENEALKETLKQLQETYELVCKADNPATFVDSDLQQRIAGLEKLTYLDRDGSPTPLLQPDEINALSVSKGTLTEDERQIMEEHVNITEKMLSMMPFTRYLSNVPRLACMHHEQLNGAGYPYGLEAKEIPLDARILAVSDVFDALTASDRPYKKGMPPERALEIMGYMVQEGKLDGSLVKLLEERRIWEKMETE